MSDKPPRKPPSISREIFARIFGVLASAPPKKYPGSLPHPDVHFSPDFDEALRRFGGSEEAARGISGSAPGGGSSPPRSPRPEPDPRGDPDHEHHPTTKIFDYIALGLLLTPPGVVAELYLRGETIDLGRAVVLCLVCWLGGALFLWAARKWRAWQTTLAAAENKFWVKAIIVATFMAVPILIAPFLAPNNQRHASLPDTAVSDQTQKQLSAQDRTIQELQAEIAQLRAPYWDSLSPIELENLGNRLKQVPTRSIIINCSIGQCRDLANSLMGALGIGGWTNAKLDTETTWIGPNTGIEIIPGDETARLLKAAIEGATGLRGIRISPYSGQVSGVGPNQTVITIGVKPVQ